MQTSPLAPDIQRIKNRGVLIVALHSVDQPPFFFIDKKNELAGLDIEISKGIASGLGVKVEFNRKAKSFNDLIDIVDRGEADLVISKLSRTLSRAQIINFSTPYITFRQALILNRLELAKKAPSNEDIVPFIKDFTGKIGVITNSSYVNYAKKNFPRATIVELPTWDDVVSAVFSGEILAGYRDEMEIKKIIKGRSDASLKVKSIIIKDVTDPIAIGIAPRDAQLLVWVNLYLENLNLNLDAEKLLDRYPEIFLQK
jgi:polar amino acid transport system substrate-binding protein